MHEPSKLFAELYRTVPMLEAAIDNLTEVAVQRGALQERMRVLELLKDLSESGFIQYNQYEAIVMDICMGDGADLN